MRRLLPAAGLLAATILAGVTMTPETARAYGVFFGFGYPGYAYGPPVFVPPPVYYAPPPVYYPPPAYPGPYAPAPYAPAPYAPVASAAGPRCYAGLYVCPVARPGPVGSPCACPSNNGSQPGIIR